MTDKERIAELACKLCEAHNRSGCTQMYFPDPEHWICKSWLSKADGGDTRQPKPIRCQDCRHHQCYFGIDGQDCSCGLSVFVTPTTDKPPSNCPLLQPEPPADKVEAVARIIWMDDTGSDVGWKTCHEFVHKQGHCFNIAREILKLFPERGDKYKVVFNEDCFKPIAVREFATMPSGKIVVMVEDEEGNPESLWFYPDRTNPKSRLVPITVKE